MLDTVNNRQRTFAFIVLLLLLIYAGIHLGVVVPWSNSSLNKEMEVITLPSYSKNNVSLKATPLSQEYHPDLANVDFVDSQNKLRIEIRWHSYYRPLNICYVQVFVNNGTINPQLGNWSFVLESGAVNASSWRMPQSVVIPSHPAGTKITFRLNLTSGNRVSVFPTPHPLNGMVFSYLVYHSEDELAIDKDERMIIGRSSLAVLLLGTIGIIATYPYSRFETEDRKLDRSTRRDMDRQSLIAHLTSRMDSLEKLRHNFINELQALLLVLSTVAGFSFLNLERGMGNQSFYYSLVIACTIFAIPLVAVMAILMLSFWEETPSVAISGSSIDVLRNLQEGYSTQRRILSLCRRGFLYVEFFLFELVLLVLSEFSGFYHDLMLRVYRGAIILLIVFIVTGIVRFAIRELSELDDETREMIEGDPSDVKGTPQEWLL